MDYVECEEEGCEKRVPNHRLGRIKQGADWYFPWWEPSKGYCPEHLPEWVDLWRVSKE